MQQMTKEQVFSLYRIICNYDSPQLNIYAEQCKANRAFYFGLQYTKDEKEQLADRGQYDIVINKTRKATKNIVGMVAGATPKYQLIPNNTSDSNSALVANEILDWCWAKSEGVHGFKSVVKQALIDNIAYFHVIYDQFKNIKFVQLNFDEVIVDPKSKHPLFTDADMIAIPRYVSIDQVKRIYNIESLATEAPVQWGAAEIDSTMSIFLGRIFSSDKNYVKVYECYQKELYRDAENNLRQRVVKNTLVGYDVGFREVLPENITEYPIIPVYAEHTGNPYCLGEIEFMRPLQRFINKAFGVTLLNAQITSNPKLVVRENDIPDGDVDSFSNNWAIPGSINVIRQNAENPLVVSGQPLNTAFFTMYQDAKMEFDQATVPPELLGYRQRTDGTNDDLLDVREGVLKSFSDLLDNIERACRQLGVVFLQYAQAYLDDERVITIADRDGKIRRTMLNKQQGLDVSDPESIAQFQQAMRNKGYEDEQIQAIVAQAEEDEEFAQSLRYVTNSTEDIFMHLRVIERSFAPTYEMAMLRLMLKLYEISAVDNKSVLEYAPIDNKQEVINRYDRISQLQSQVQLLSDELANANALIQGREKELADSRIDQIVQKESLKLTRMQMEQKLKTLRDKYESRLLTREQKLKLKEEIARIKEQMQAEEPEGPRSLSDEIMGLL